MNYRNLVSKYNRILSMLKYHRIHKTVNFGKTQPEKEKLIKYALKIKFKLFPLKNNKNQNKRLHPI